MALILSILLVGVMAGCDYDSLDVGYIIRESVLMSLSGKSIKIIKREHRESLVPREMDHSRLRTENQTRRDLIRTVSSWIEERRETTKQVLVWPEASG